MNPEADPFNDPDDRHPRAAQLMADEDLWDCADECAPFGSDEGHEAYFEFQRWRASHPTADLVWCMDWILEGKRAEYDDRLLDDVTLGKVAAGDEAAGLLGLNYGDVFTLDATIIATALGQLVDEGRIDAAAKPFARVAVRRQSHPLLLARWQDWAAHRARLLSAIAAVIESA